MSAEQQQQTPEQEAARRAARERREQELKTRVWGPPEGTLEERVAARPESVAIVAMGRSHVTFTSMAASKGHYRAGHGEVWAINGMGGLIRHDRLFVMDDLKQITLPASLSKPGGCAEGMLSWMADHPGPVYTSRRYEEFPGTVEYPLQEVIQNLGSIYLSNSVAYTVAYAMLVGVPNIALYGCDFSYPDNPHVSEGGRACVEFLLGMAVQRGVHIRVANDSTMLDACMPNRFYGYPSQPQIDKDENGHLVVKHTDDRAG